MEKLKLTRISRNANKQDGTPHQTKDGRPFTRVGIQCEEYADTWLSGFGGDRNSSWKEGDIVEVIVEKKGEYTNFRMPRKEDELEIRIKLLEDKVFGVTATETSDDRQQLPDNSDGEGETFPFDN